MGDSNKFQCNVLPAKVYNDVLNDIIAENLGSSFKDCNILIDSASTTGDNFVGEVYRVTVKHPGKGDLSLIVKLPPQNLARRTHMVSRPSFVREFEFYEKIFPMFIKFQEEKGIDIRKEGFYEVPKCFKALEDEPFEGFFLEDLKTSGFEMFDRFKVLTVDHVNRVMEVLGKFHAISFALKDQRPEAFAQFKIMQDVLFMRDEFALNQYAFYFNSVKEQAFGVFGVNESQDLVQRARKSLAMEFPELMKSCVTGELSEPYAALCHGDCWNNNIMYRHENGVPIECRVLDWQVVRYASPVLDLMNYLFTCTTKELRDKHYHEFLDVYHEILFHFLLILGSDPVKLFPKDAFHRQLKKFGKFGLMMSILHLPMMTSNPEDVPDLEKGSENIIESQKSGREVAQNLQFTSANTVDAYSKRMKEVFQDICDLSYI